MVSLYGTLSIFELATCKCLNSIEIEASLVDSAFSIDTKLIAVTDATGGFSLWTFEDDLKSVYSTQLERIDSLGLYYLPNNSIHVIGKLRMK